MWQLFLLVVGVSSLSASLLVDLPLGKVWGESRQGFHPTGTLVNWTSFAGIPFAQPPVGKLRFLPPQPPNSTEQRPPVMCPQVRTRCPQVVGQELNCIKTSNLQCAMCDVQCAMCNVQYAICNVHCAICAMCRRSMMINTKVGGATGLLEGSDEDCLQVNEIEYPQSAQSKK